MDTDQRPVLNQVNIVARDWDATLAFYRLLGVDIADGVQFGPANASRHAAVHVDVPHMTIEFDNPDSLCLFAADAPNIRTPILGFACPTSEAVDAAFERISAAGHPVRQAPYDAFWGARYAIVEDPNGNAVGLMGPIERSRGYAPSGPPRP